MKNIFSKSYWNKPDCLSEEDRKVIADKYETLFKDIIEKYPEHVPTPEEIELEKLKKNYKFHNGEIYALKDGAHIWVIPLQYTLCYHREDRLNPMYVQVNSWAWDNSCVFCHRVEKNMFGMLSWDKCELEVAFDSLDLSKIYKEEEMVNVLPYIDYVYNDNKNIKEDEETNKEHSENQVE